MRRLIIPLLIWALSTDCHAQTTTLDEVYLKTHASFRNYTPQAWGSSEDISVVVKIRPQTSSGQVFGVKAVDKMGVKVFQLKVSLEQAVLKVELTDNDGNTIIDKPKGGASQVLNQSDEQTIAVVVNPGERTVKYKVGVEEDRVAVILREINMTDTETVVTLGGGDTSLIGCITLVSLAKSEEITHQVVKVAENEVDSCGDESDCSRRDCGAGKCKNTEVAVCDCFETGKTGPNCKSDIRTAFVNNNDDDDVEDTAFIQYNVVGDVNGVFRIAMQFKFNDDKDNGVLLYGDVESGVEFKMFVADDGGSLIVGDEKSSFKIRPVAGYHSLIILIEPTHLLYSVDNHTQMVPLKENAADLKFKSLTFGASPVKSSDVGSDEAITACFRSVYVNYDDVIDLMYNKDPKIRAPVALRQCASALPISAAGLSLSKPLPQDHSSSVSHDHSFPLMADEDDNALLGEIVAGDNDDPPEEKPTVWECENMDATQCRNGASCEKSKERGARCICADGYGGHHCQFVLFPRTCAEAKLFYGLPDGPTYLDVDGSQPEPRSVAVCTNGTTVIEHDLMPHTVLRGATINNHSQWDINYRDFSHNEIKTLFAMSNRCRQAIEYDCNKAAIDFEGNRTFFRSVHSVENATISKIGKVARSCDCLDSGCIGGGKCNCDARGIASDRGTLAGLDAGLTKIVALNTVGDVEASLSLGRLECSGFGASAAIRFTSRRSLHVDTWNGQGVSFQFRTADASANLLSIGNGYNNDINIDLVNGHTIRLNFSGSIINVESQTRLNNTRWHLVRFENYQYSNEARISIDKNHAFGKVPESAGWPIEGLILVNDGSDRGFIGCLRSFYLNDYVVDLHQKGSEQPDIELNCEDACRADFCQNNAQCVENFRNNVAQCQCRYPNIQSGLNCEIDINHDSSVSFHGGYLKYEDMRTPLTEQTVFSFRTDQANALLFFAHDQFNNFIQVHLSHEVNITLTLNNGDAVSSCTVRAPAGTEYGDMRWIQISIDHTAESSSLTVEEDTCTISTLRQLSTQFVTKYTNVFTDIVIIPIGVSSPNDREPFVYIFVGGVERAVESNDGSKVLHPVYQMAVPDLLGCMRGLRIGGEVISLRHTTKGYRPSDPTLVRIGCEVRCESLQCQNGGHCSVAWKDYNPETSKTNCDCSRTSYSGEYCEIDDGINLHAQSTVAFDVSHALSKYIIDETSKRYLETFKFAFSSMPAESKKTQVLAVIYFKDGRHFEVLLNRNGTINVGIVSGTKEDSVITVPGNYTDGYRHYFVAEFGKRMPTAIMVDSIRIDFDYLPSNLDLFDAELVVVGGEKETDMITTNPKYNYDGCISNVKLDYKMSILQFEPLITVHNESLRHLAWFNPATSVSDRQRCAEFRIKNTLPVFQNNVRLPVWETNSQRRYYDYQDPEEGGFPWLLVLMITLLVLCLMICCLLCFCCCYKKKDTGPRRPEEVALTVDEVPLPYHPQKQRRPVQSNYDLPPPEVDLGKVSHNGRAAPKAVEAFPPLPPSPPAKSALHSDTPTRRDRDASEPQRDRVASLRSSLTSGIVGYYTAQEGSLTQSSSDDDLDRTLCDEARTPTPFDNDGGFVTRPTSFERVSPQRMSSFRKTDPTAPVGSPLHMSPQDARTPRRPIPVPPPRFSPNTTREDL